MGLSGRLNTAFIERVNLTVRHGIAALARRTWAMAKPAPQLLAHLEWWRAYSHFVRPHQSLRVALVQPAAARWQIAGTTVPAAYSSHGGGENEPTMDGAGSAVPSLIAGAMRPQVSMKDVRRRPVKEQERFGEGENRDKCLDRQHESPSLKRPMRRKPARHAFSGG
jgi:hypothetical protein